MTQTKAHLINAPLEALTNVQGSPSNGQTLIWNSTLQKWVPGATGGVLVAANAATAAPPATLLLHFDNSIADSSPSAVNASGSNLSFNSSTVKFGTHSVYFNGSTSSLSVGNPAFRFGTDDFTIDFWINCLTAGRPYPYILASSVYNSGSGFYANINGAGTSFGGTGVFSFISVPGSNGPGLTSTTVIRNNGWRHIAITRQGATFRLFVDGNLEASASAASANFTGTGGYIGTSVSSPGYDTENCYLDEFRVIKGFAAYTSNFTPPTQPYSDTGGTLISPPSPATAGQQYTDGVYLYTCIASGSPGTWKKALLSSL